MAVGDLCLTSTSHNCRISLVVGRRTCHCRGVRCCEEHSNGVPCGDGRGLLVAVGNVLSGIASCWPRISVGLLPIAGLGDILDLDGPECAASLSTTRGTPTGAWGGGPSLLGVGLHVLAAPVVMAQGRQLPYAFIASRGCFICVCVEFQCHRCVHPGVLSMLMA